VNSAIVDAAVVLKWFREDGERDVDEARALLAAFRAGELILFVPPLLFLEILNVAGRRWRWGESELLELAESLDHFGFDVIEPDLARVAYWTARGLTAYDAAYVAVAEAQETLLVTDDQLVLNAAGHVARALAGA
jgi:predicted nucleic acid-binding protein